MDLSNVLAFLAKLVTVFFSWMSSAASFILNQPVLLISCTIAIISFVFGIIIRFIKGAE